MEQNRETVVAATAAATKSKDQLNDFCTFFVFFLSETTFSTIQFFRFLYSSCKLCVCVSIFFALTHFLFICFYRMLFH